jgi:hypothetical protein
MRGLRVIGAVGDVQVIEHPACLPGTKGQHSVLEPRYKKRKAQVTKLSERGNQKIIRNNDTAELTVLGLLSTAIP